MVKRKKARKEKVQKDQTAKVIILAIIFGAVAGALASSLIIQTPAAVEKSQEDLIKEFYDVETATHVSPHHVRKDIMKGKSGFVIVDLRSEEEYIEEHIVGALNVPAYKDRDHSDYGAVERIVSSFKQIQADNPDKEIIVYCYSIPCMTGRKMGKVLADNGIYVKHLGVGWNEWRYFWTLWNHPHEWETTNVEDYVSSGPEPGTLPESALVGAACPIAGEFGC